MPSIPDDKYVVFISGLNLSSNNDLTPFQLFVDYMTGMIGGNKEVARVSLGSSPNYAREIHSNLYQSLKLELCVPDGEGVQSFHLWELRGCPV